MIATTPEVAGNLRLPSTRTTVGAEDSTTPASSSDMVLTISLMCSSLMFTHHLGMLMQPGSQHEFIHRASRLYRSLV